MSEAGGAVGKVGGRGCGRGDMSLEESGRDCIREVNTIPGFTSHSLVPKAAGQAGMSLGVICERIAGTAMRR